MKTLFRVIFAAILLGGWAVAASAVYLVRTPEKLIVVPKNRLTLRGTYVDTRAWKLDDAANHPELLVRLIDTGKIDRLGHVAPKEKLLDAAAQVRQGEK